MNWKTESKMGNRAVITTAPYGPSNVGIYIHWNGGRASVEGFLLAARELGYHNPVSDPSYGLARLVQAIGLFFGASGSINLGIGRCDSIDADNGDNGTYLIGADWQIVGRKFFDPAHDREDAVHARSVADHIIAITAVATGAAK